MMTDKGHRGALKVKSQEEEPVKAKSNVDKVDNAAAKSKAKDGKLVKGEPKAGDGDDVDGCDSEDDDSEESDDDDDVDMTEAMGDGDDDKDRDEDDDEDVVEDDESSEEEDVETPKKRPAEASSKTSAPEKKAKLMTPASGQKTGGDGKNDSPGK